MRYLYIGEIAELLGVSKDTIRIYEEQGLIFPVRDENGFRRYTEEDLDRLIPVKFYRENALPMKDLRRLMIQKSRESSLALLEEQIKAERRELLRHKRNMERLELARTYYLEGPDTFELCTVGSAYRISKVRADYYDTLVDWFQGSKEDPDRIICYLNAEYDLKKSLEKPERCYLLIKEPEARYLGRQDLMEMSERIEGGSMVRAIQHTEKLFPDGELFAAAARWAGERGITLLGNAHAHNLYMSEKNGKPMHALEVVMPCRLPGVAGKIPGVVPLDPAGAHDAVVAEVVPLVVFPEPVIAVVGAVAVLVLVPLGGADPSGGQGGNGVCRRQGQG